MTKTAWVFPGQGSQASGMGLDLRDIPQGQQRYQEAADVFGWSVTDVGDGGEVRLSQPQYTQPCLYVVAAILADLLRERGQTPDVVAGHSLGEYVGLYVAGVFDFAAGLTLVQKRSELMSQASDGKMAALMGFDRGQLEEIVNATTDVVLANDNHAGQVVISGSPTAVETVLANVKVKRAVELNVSGAFHSPLMSGAAEAFESILADIPFQAAAVPVLSNVEPTPETDPATLKDRLMQQITGPVRWRETCLQFTEMGVTQVCEVGPGKVLTGLTKRTCKGVGLVNISSSATLPDA